MRAWLRAVHVPLAPYSSAFLRIHGAPAGGQFSGRDEKISAGFGLKRIVRSPCVVRHQGGVLARLICRGVAAAEVMIENPVPFSFDLSFRQAIIFSEFWQRFSGVLSEF